MKLLLYGLNVDYVRENGHFMVLSEEGGLDRERLAAFQVQMLLSNKIPHLLPIQLEERDHQVQLYYQITGARMLTHWLRMSSMSLKQLFSLLLEIVDVVSQSHVYMLQEGRYVLKEDFIYCGEHLTDVQLTYMPIEALPEKNTVPIDLQHLAARLIHKVSELSGSGYQELMSYLIEDSFNLSGCKQLLQKHISLLEDQAPYSSHKSPAPPTYHQNGGTVGPDAPARRFTSESLQSMHGAEPASPKPVNETSSPPLFSPSWFEEEEEEAAAQQNQRNKKVKIPLLLVSALVLALIWKLYLDQRAEGWLFVCSGLSLLVIDLVFIVLKVWKREGKEDGALTWADVHKSLSQANHHEEQQEAALLPFYSLGKEDPNLRKTTGISTPGQEFNNEAYYERLGQRTTLLSPPDETVLLNASMLKSGAQQAALPYFEWSHSGVKQVVHIHKFPFVIGREGQGIDFAHLEPGVSRIHAEITVDNENIMLKDLGSRNGTYMNGEKLVPYRMYILKEGDIVKLISTEFAFKMGL